MLCYLPFNFSFIISALMRKLPSFTKFAFMQNPHVYMHQLQCRYFITCVVENRQLEWSVTWAQCLFAFFNLCDVRMCIATQQTRDIESMLGQCWPAVYDVGPTSSQHWLNVSCLPAVYDVGPTSSQHWLNVLCLLGITCSVPRGYLRDPP